LFLTENLVSIIKASQSFSAVHGNNHCLFYCEKTPLQNVELLNVTVPLGCKGFM